MQGSHSYFLLPWLLPSVVGVGGKKNRPNLPLSSTNVFFQIRVEWIEMNAWYMKLSWVNLDLQAWQPPNLFPLLCLIKAEWSCQLVYNVVLRYTKKSPLVPEMLLAQEFINAIRSWVLFLEYSLNPGTSAFSPNVLKDKLKLCYRPSEPQNFQGFHKCNMRKLF